MKVDVDENLYKSTGASVSVICATIGLLIALALNLLMGTIVLALSFPIPIILGLLFLYLSAFVYGRIGGDYVYRIKSKNYKVELIGILIAFSTVLTMSLAGSFYYFIKAINFNNVGETVVSAAGSYLFKPVFWVGFFGLIPSIILGICWGRIFRNRTNQSTE